MDENEKKDTLELFDKVLDLKFESDELKEDIRDLIEQCEIDLKESV